MGLLLVGTTMGCGHFCERWCGTPRPVNCCQPCVPVCCPPACCPAPVNYQPQSNTSWAQPRGNVPCCQ
jgi:hypothetical protein